MSLRSWWKHPCRFGHKWFYVRGMWCPFDSFLGTPFWRGCTVCHKDQAPAHSSMEGILEWHWEDAPNLRHYEEWREFLHPSGWTKAWYTPPQMTEQEWAERGGYSETFSHHI